MEKNVLKEIIVEQQQNLLRPSVMVARSNLAKVLRYVSLPHSVIIAGIRRAGKSVLLQQIMPYIKGGYYYFNFEDERLVNFTVADFNSLYETLIELYGIRKTFFFDEIQNILGWERFVRRMQDSGNKFFITGSNATLLSRELGTKLTGRYVSVELYPFSFAEFLVFNNVIVSIDTLLDTTKRAKVKHEFNRYFNEGGMPEFLTYKTKEALSKVYENILYRDIITRYELKDERPMRELCLYLFSNVGTVISYSKLKDTLELGSVNTIKSYLRYLENSFLFFDIRAYHASVKKQIISPPKIYCIDNALARIAGFHFTENKGHFLENVVFLELRRRGCEIFYYRTQGNGEVDFVTRQGGHIEQAIQVTWSLTEGVRERELSALVSALDELQLKEGLILTDNEEKELDVGNKHIMVKPVYRWLLENK